MFGFGNRRVKAPSDIVERLERVERDQKQLRMEWEETLDKVYRWMKRTQKRDRDEAKESANGEPSESAPVHPAVARILARRGVRGARGSHPAVSAEG